MTLREEAEYIIKESIRQVMPDEAVTKALRNRDFGAGRVYLVSVGKAAWQMAKTAADVLGNRLEAGICITKYDHVRGMIDRVECIEAGHPVPDANSFQAAEKAIRLVENLCEEDTVLFLVSGGGSALFEKPLIPEKELAAVTDRLLACGADIVEMNTVRKRLSGVKGGRFAKICEPAKVYAVVLSDILGDPLDMIASGPVCSDASTCAQALAVAEKYHLCFSEKAWQLMRQETPKEVTNVETVITGSVRNLCRAAAELCESLGYETHILTDRLTCEAREAGKFMAAIALSHQDSGNSLAYIAGGETVVHVTGKGKGGRNQEIVLAAAEGISGLKETALFSVGSDGTDGPTDAAGGYCDGETGERLRKLNVDIRQMLEDNNSYEALKRSGGLMFTGATGTNVNDVSVLLIRRQLTEPK